MANIYSQVKNILSKYIENYSSLPKMMIVAGPTGSGKTNLIKLLCDQYPIETISVDSVSIYRNFNIAASKPSPLEQMSCKYHLIDIIDPDQQYSVFEFVSTVLTVINDINNRGNIAVLSGGTMMYFNALIHGIDKNIPRANVLIREKLSQELQLFGLEYLYNQLINFSSIYKTSINPHDTQRIMRGLEVCLIQNQRINHNNTQSIDNHKDNMNNHHSAINIDSKISINQLHFTDKSIISLVLYPERKHLHEAINARFLQMIKDGAIEEVEYIIKKYPHLDLSYSSMRSAGYKQIYLFLQQKISMHDLIETAQAATRQIAKRQYTWIKKINFPNIHTISI